jgi:hypothetical protein
MARIIGDVRGVLAANLAGVEVEILERQILAGKVYSVLVLVPGRRLPVKISPRMLEATAPEPLKFDPLAAHAAFGP